MRTLFAATNVFYLAALTALLAALEWHGERQWALAALLYFPPTLWLAPAAGFAFLFLLLRSKILFAANFVCVVLALWLYVGFRHAPQREPRGQSITIVTNNIGEGNLDDLSRFATEQKAQVLLVQDAFDRRRSRLAGQFPRFYTAARGEFLICSRFPIRMADLITDIGRGRYRPVGARFEIVMNGRPVVLYSIHMPTPRRDLERIRGRLVFRNWKEFRKAMDDRVEVARALANRLSSEKGPFIAAGDFNMADHGYLYHLFRSRFTDAFAERGRGFGLTFPGDVRQPIALNEPWLRLDYFFSANGWEPVSVRVCPTTRAQHRPVAAVFELAR